MLETIKAVKIKETTREEIKSLLKLLMNAYPNWEYNKKTKEEDIKKIIDIWYRLFKNNRYEYLLIAVDKFIIESKYPPTIADIKERYYKIVGNS